MCSIAHMLKFFRIFVAKFSLMAEEMDMQHTETEAPKRMVLRAEGLVKKYGKRTVVNGVNFEVRQGEIVGLLGPNGAGKTTSFYMTTGLVVPNGGHVYLDDLEITDFPVYKHAKAGIGYLAQEASVFRKMSVEDNIASVLELTDLTEEDGFDYNDFDDKLMEIEQGLMDIPDSITRSRAPRLLSQVKEEYNVFDADGELEAMFDDEDLEEMNEWN